MVYYHIRRLLFNRDSRLPQFFSVGGIAGLGFWAADQYFQNWIWEFFVSFVRDTLKLGTLTRGQTIFGIFLAILFGILVAALFSLGEWCGRQRQPEFFADRKELEKRDGSAPLDSVETAHCIWLIGQRTFRTEEGIDKIKKLVLPNPNSASVSLFQKAGPESVNIADDIVRVTRKAQKHGVEVRWYPEFTGQSWWIGNRERLDAFVHIECLLPYSPPNRRPAFRVHKWQDEGFYHRHCQIFDQIWDNSFPPSLGPDDLPASSSKVTT